MTTDTDDFTELLEAWLEQGTSEEDPSRIMDRALARVEATPRSRFPWLARAGAFTESTLRFAFAATAMAIVAVAGLALVSSGTWLGGHGGPAVSTSAAPSVPELSNILGLPPVGAAPSDPTPGELVLRFESSDTANKTVWVYADGRMLWSPFRSTPAGVGDEFTGLVEQRLTAQGVAFLQSRVASTGLFADDLLLLREGNAPFLRIDLRTGDRLVRVTWAWRGIAGDEPVASAEQEAALQALNTLFQDPSLWPASAWEDDAMTAYVPSSYAVCIGVRPDAAGPGEWTGPVEPAEVWALLPERAQEWLRAGEPTTKIEAMHADAGCTQLTTDDARALARSLEAGGLKRSQPGSGEYFVAYAIHNPIPAWDELWIQFGPVLPDGEATWLGPG